MNALDEFTALLTESQSSRFRDLCRQMEADWQRDATEMWRARNPRKKRIPTVTDMVEGYPEIQAEYERRKAVANALVTAEDAARAIRKSRMDELARDLPVTPCDTLHKVYEIDEGSYRTMGFSAWKYAKADAEHHADKYRTAGLTVEVRTEFIKYDRPITTAGGWTSTGYDLFTVWVNIDPVNQEILNRKPITGNLRDWVRSCWKRGVNPRVYCPFLPYEYEQNNNLDYFGNDIAVKAGSAGDADG